MKETQLEGSFHSNCDCWDCRHQKVASTPSQTQCQGGRTSVGAVQEGLGVVLLMFTAKQKHLYSYLVANVSKSDFKSRVTAVKTKD